MLHATLCPARQKVVLKSATEHSLPSDRGTGMATMPILANQLACVDEGVEIASAWGVLVCLQGGGHECCDKSTNTKYDRSRDVCNSYLWIKPHGDLLSVNPKALIN